LQPGIASYDVESGTKATKKRAPAYSSTKAKQHVLWDEGKLSIKNLILMF
jgi:hypothetical protein